MPSNRRVFMSKLSPAVAVLALTLLYTSTIPAQQADNAASTAPPIHLLRALVGAKGENRNGGFVMTEARSVFYAPQDHEVIVYFEWQGPKGTHHCEGSVHGPNGTSATMSSFDYNATLPRWAGFWKVPLSEGTPPGGWTFETKVDGQAAGEVSFQVFVAAKPANLPATSIPAEKPLPTPGDIYTRALAASVEVEILDAQGRTFHHSSGFLMKGGTVMTSFRGIDGASGLRLRLAGGQELSSPMIAAWNRQQDWVVLATDSKADSSLTFAEAKSWKIGDPCYWLEVRSDGSRTLSNGEVVGLVSRAPWSDRIDFSGAYDSLGMGGPLLNDRGEVIGILGGVLPDTYLQTAAPQAQSDSELVFYRIGGIAVAGNLLPQSLPSTPSTLKDLWDKGQMTAPLIAARYIMYGMITQGGQPVQKKPSSADREDKFLFQRSDNSAGVFVHFANTMTLKSVAAMKVYDLDNHPVVASAPQKITVNPGQHTECNWQIPISKLPAGIYRVDVELTEGVAWREYFKVTD
jgi:hypothetical protein